MVEQGEGVSGGGGLPGVVQGVVKHKVLDKHDFMDGNAIVYVEGGYLGEWVEGLELGGVFPRIDVGDGKIDVVPWQGGKQDKAAVGGSGADVELYIVILCLAFVL